MKKIFAFVFLIGLLTFPLTASAQFSAATSKLKTVAGGTGLTDSFEGSVSTIITGVLSLAGTIFLVLTIYAGILWMTASGNEEQVTKAKGIVTQAVIGLAITLAAYAITAFVTGKLTSTPAGAPAPSACLTAEKACVLGGGGPCSGTLYPSMDDCVKAGGKQ
ncbi:MAG: hypothetical protein WCT11_04395 [Candidatus Magasanikbacteria bacterium]